MKKYSTYVNMTRKQVSGNRTTSYEDSASLDVDEYNSCSGVSFGKAMEFIDSVRAMFKTVFKCQAKGTEFTVEVGVYAYDDEYDEFSDTRAWAFHNYDLSEYSKDELGFYLAADDGSGHDLWIDPKDFMDTLARALKF